jgi:mannose-1-phosphate guanylyltransferase
MLIIAHHKISNPEKFWNAAKENTKQLPANIKLHGIYPAKDQKTGTCLWEAGTVQEVQQFIDRHTGNFAKNFCYEVNVKDSVGLPAIKLEAVHAN